MCGIAGAIDRHVERGRRRVERLNECQYHRGPDHTAIVTIGSLTIGNTRLSIQDPSPSGNQPFWSIDGRYVCVFNGEIYNYAELIDEFGLDLRNHCDGAVIPELWARMGRACLRRFAGMYAIAVLDTATNQLSICRDPFGIKPLYVRTLADGAVIFGSEVRALASIETMPDISRDAIARYLYLGALPGDCSPFDGITAVPPNSVVTFGHDGRREVSPIFPGRHPLTRFDAASEREYVDVGSVLRESVEMHLRSDVPVVLLLSSGVDSTALASAARQQGHVLQCMTVAGVGPSDESDAAATAAAKYGHAHHVVPARIDDGALADYFAAMQRPTIDGLNTFIVCRAVQASGHRVALSGLGGDEALGGYAHYRLLPALGILRAVDRVSALGSGLHRLGERMSTRLKGDKARRLIQVGGPRSAWGLDLLQREVHSPGRVRDMTGVDIFALQRPLDDESCTFESLVEAELSNYMQATLLPDADGFSMCSSVELRVPFVHRPFFIAAARANQGRRWPVGKRLLASALGDPFLLELCHRRKRGFSVPMASWLSDGPLRPAAERLQDRGAPIWDFVRRSEALAIIAAASPERWSELWSLASLNQWLSSIQRVSSTTS